MLNGKQLLFQEPHPQQREAKQTCCAGHKYHSAPDSRSLPLGKGPSLHGRASTRRAFSSASAQQHFQPLPFV